MKKIRVALLALMVTGALVGANAALADDTSRILASRTATGCNPPSLLEPRSLPCRVPTFDGDSCSLRAESQPFRG